METAEDKTCFIDTNIIVFASDSRSPWHQSSKEAINKLLNEKFRLFISPQILREYISVASRFTEAKGPVPWDKIMKNCEDFQKDFILISEDQNTVTELGKLLLKIPSYGKQVHDANVVATMLAHGISNLLTHNTDDFSRYSQLINIISL
jgi:predicted nucleic acid-binding protein